MHSCAPLHLVSSRLARCLTGLGKCWWHGMPLNLVPDDCATAHQEALMAADDCVILELLLHTSLRWSPLRLLAWLPLMEHPCEPPQKMHLMAAACATYCCQQHHRRCSSLSANQVPLVIIYRDCRSRRGLVAKPMQQTKHRGCSVHLLLEVLRFEAAAAGKQLKLYLALGVCTNLLCACAYHDWPKHT